MPKCNITGDFWINKLGEEDHYLSKYKCQKNQEFIIEGNKEGNEFEIQVCYFHLPVIIYKLLKYYPGSSLRIRKVVIYA